MRSKCAGLLHQRDGDAEQAVTEIDAAVELAEQAEDRWRQVKCLASVAMIELERRQPRAALARASVLKQAASELGESAEEPLAQAIEALSRLMSGDETAPLDAAIAHLRLADDKSRLAWVLNLAAAIRLDRKELAPAENFATDALSIAKCIGETDETLVAQATLARVALAQGDRERALLAFETLAPVLEAPDVYSARATRAAEFVSAGIAALRASVSGPAR